MTTRHLICALYAGLIGLSAWAADPLVEAAAKAKLEYAERLKAATAELTAARARIDAERKPLVEATRSVESRIAALSGELSRLEIGQAGADESRQRLRRDVDAERRNLAYFLSQAQETMKVVEDSLLPGERAVWGERLDTLRGRLDKAAAQDGAPVAMTTADLVLERLLRGLGGYSARGKAVRVEDNRVVEGAFVYVGPEVFFKSEKTIGVVRLRPGGEWPAVHPVPGWTPAKAGAWMEGGRGVVPLDASGGKAFTLRMTKGSWLDQVRKGGLVGYVILAVGLLALAIALQKLADFRRLAVDEPPAVRRPLGLIATASFEEAASVIQGLKATTRELFTIGLANRQKPRALLEEHLDSFVLQQRMLQERRLPLLAVVATSGPLLGLLGTVSGMIKTFTLITVFGTGSAGKLSAGISEALVATKFGLMVAIPALVVHGFLSQRIQKHLSMLERYALEIATASEESRRAKQPVEAGEP